MRLSRLFARLARIPPGCSQRPCRLKVRLLYLIEHLLIDRIVVVRELRPLAEEWHERLEEKSCILDKTLPFDGSRSIVQLVEAGLYVEESVAPQEGSQLIKNPITFLVKEMSGLAECLRKQFTQTGMSLARTLDRWIGL